MWFLSLRQERRHWWLCLCDIVSTATTCTLVQHENLRFVISINSVNIEASMWGKELAALCKDTIPWRSVEPWHHVLPARNKTMQTWLHMGVQSRTLYLKPGIHFTEWQVASTMACMFQKAFSFGLLLYIISEVIYFQCIRADFSIYLHSNKNKKPWDLFNKF